jgi:hypothetical protein
MWQRFTERARRMVFYAQEEATRLGTDYVGTEHLLLGLLREQDHMAARILIGMGVSLARIRSAIERQVVRGSGTTTGDKQLTPAAKRSIDLAYDEARQLGNNYIGTEHLLLGLIREGSSQEAGILSVLGVESAGVAGSVLASLGVDLSAVRQEVQRCQDEATTKAEDSGSGKRAVEGVRDLVSRLRGKSPDDVADAEEPMRGDIGVLRNEDGRNSVEFVPDEAHLEEFLEVMRLKDEFAYRFLVAEGRILLLPAGTGAKFLQRIRPDIYRVRVLDGDHAGTVGFVLRKQLHDTRQDDRPFPPEIV